MRADAGRLAGRLLRLGIRYVVARRFRRFCAARLSHALSAQPFPDELAFAGDRRQARGGPQRACPAACDKPAAAPSEIALGLGRLSGLASRARAQRRDPLRQLCPGSRRQMVARLPAHRGEPVVPLAVSDAAVAGAAGDGGVRDDGPGPLHRDLGRRRPDRTPHQPEINHLAASIRGRLYRKSVSGCTAIRR